MVVYAKNTAYIAALIPTVLTFVKLIYGFVNGYFQASFIKLENQKHNLETQVNTISNQKNEPEERKAKLTNSIKETELLLEEKATQIIQIQRTPQPRN